METHRFHKAIGSLSDRGDYPRFDRLRIFRDSACDPHGKGHRISLYNQKSGTRVRFCDVDLLIAAGEYHFTNPFFSIHLPQT